MLNLFHSRKSPIRLRSSSRGFSLAEMLLALTLLTFGLLANVPLIMLAQNQNALKRYQLLAASMAEREMDQTSTHAFPPGGSFQDHDGNWIQMSCGRRVNACGSSLNAAGAIDFTVPGVTGFSFTETDPQGVVYDVRWNIHTMSGTKVLVVLGVHAQKGILLVPPVTLKTYAAL